MGLFSFGSLSKTRTVKVSVQLLDDSETVTNEFKRSEPAQAILDYVLEVMNIKEKDYFGLRYQDHNKHRYWVDLSRPISHISKQFKFAVADTLMLRLRFRFYPNDPHLLKEEITRYQLFVQLQRDLLHGRLYCPQQLSAQLAALVLQSQLGDYDSEKHGEHYVSEYKLLLKQTPKIEETIEGLHKEMSGKLTAAEAELEFLEKACQLDTYGFDPYTVKDPRDTAQPAHAVYVGVTHRGVLVYKGNVKAHHIPWDQLCKVDYVSKEVRIIPKDSYDPPVHAEEAGEDGTVGSPDKKRRLVIKLLCPTGVFAKHLWTHILSEQAFFNEQAAALVKPKFSKPRIPLLSRGSTFRFPSRRVLKEIETSFDEEPPRQEVSFSRYQLPRQEPRTEAPWLNKYHTLPNLKVHTANGKADKRKSEENKENEEKKQETSLLDEMARLVTVGPGPETSADVDCAAGDNNKENGVPSLYSDPSPSGGFQAISKEATPPGSFTQNVPEPESGLSESSIIGDPLMTSTPSASSAGVVNRNATRDAVARRAAAVADEVATTFKFSGSAPMANGDVSQSESFSSRSSVVQRVTNTFFASFLVLLLVVALAIAVFENHGESGDWVSGNAMLSRVRHEYYEPARHVFLQTYARYVGVGK